MCGDSARRGTDSVRAGAVSRRALSRVLSVLLLCVGIGLGVVSPSQADATGVGGSFTVHGDGTATTPGTWSVVDNTTSTDWLFRVTVTIPSSAPSGAFYWQPVMHCAAGDRAGQWMWGTQSSVSWAAPSSANVGWSKDACSDVDQIGVQSPYGAYGWTGTAPSGPVESTTPGPPDVAAGACIGRDWQLAALLRSVGWVDDADGRVALAVLLAESSGRVNALHQNTDGSYDVGLFQINTSVHPDFDAARLGVDPLYNAVKAYGLRQGAGGWGQWTTYATGQYRSYLERAAAAWVDPAAADVLPAASCAQLTGQQPATGDPADPNDPATSGGECSGWNPLTYIKCALVWAFVPADGAMGAWSSKVGTWSDRFPVNVMVSGTQAVGAFTEAVRCSDSSCSVPDRDPRAVAFDGLPGGGSVDILGGMSDEAVSPTLNRVRDFTGWLIWIGGSVYIWRRVSASFGGKDAA